jgi:hypothetical protein
MAVYSGNNSQSSHKFFAIIIRQAGRKFVHDPRHLKARKISQRRWEVSERMRAHRAAEKQFWDEAVVGNRARTGFLGGAEIEVRDNRKKVKGQRR